MEKSIKAMQDKHADAGARLKDIDARISSKLNELDGLEAAHRSKHDAITVVTDAQKRGYTTPTIVRLFKDLESYEVKGDPDESVSKLLQRIEVEHSTARAETMRDNVRAEKETLLSEVNHVKGTLDGYKDIVVGTIGAAERNASQAMSSVRDQSLTSVKQVADDAVQNITKMESQATIRGQNIYNKWDSEVRIVQSNVIAAYQVAINSLAIYKKHTDDWGAARQGSGRLEREIQEATILLSIRKDPEKIASLSPELMLQLVLAVDVYLKRRLPNLSVLPTERVKKDDPWVWGYVHPLKIWTLSTWIADVLATQIKEGSI